MRLQQSPAFWELPREFVPFTQITGRAGDDKVANIIGGNVGSYHSANGERMIDVMFSPRHFVAAVIAVPLLSSVQISYLLRSVRSWYGFFQCVTVTHVGIMLCIMGYSVLLSVNAPFLSMFHVESVAFQPHRFPVFSVAHFIFFPEQIGTATALLSSLLIYFFFVLLMQNLTACLAYTIKSVIMTTPCAVEILRRFRKHFQAFLTSLFMFAVLYRLSAKCTSLTSALFAAAAQFIFSSACFMKIGRCCRKYTQTLHAVLFTFLAGRRSYSKCTSLVTWTALFAKGMPSIYLMRGFMEVGRCTGQRLLAALTDLNFAFMQFSIDDMQVCALLAVYSIMLFVYRMPLLHTGIYLVLMLFSILLVSCAVTSAASWLESFSVWWKEIGSCRKEFLALYALLLRGVFGYDVAHSLGQLLAITPLGYVEYPQGQYDITSALYHKPAPQASFHGRLP